mmetsp:Transcript_17441/g.47687  ORF Transcript_17441/g.47687 Transcript_17441/m.47687 type:complete len:302 (-) Transcript_17441:884-1789(-)
MGALLPALLLESSVHGSFGTSSVAESIRWPLAKRGVRDDRASSSSATLLALSHTALQASVSPAFADATSSFCRSAGGTSISRSTIILKARIASAKSAIERAASSAPEKRLARRAAEQLSKTLSTTSKMAMTRSGVALSRKPLTRVEQVHLSGSRLYSFMLSKMFHASSGRCPRTAASMAVLTVIKFGAIPCCLMVFNTSIARRASPRCAKPFMMMLSETTSATLASASSLSRASTAANLPAATPVANTMFNTILSTAILRSLMVRSKATEASKSLFFACKRNTVMHARMEGTSSLHNLSKK